jgi:hypothetical protein
MVYCNGVCLVCDGVQLSLRQWCPLAAKMVYNLVFHGVCKVYNVVFVWCVKVYNIHMYTMHTPWGGGRPVAGRAVRRR